MDPPAAAAAAAAAAAPALPPLDPSTPPFLQLQPDEQLLHCHLVEYLDRAGLAWLTSQRVLVRADRPTPQLQARRAKAATDAERASLDKHEQFQLPLANVSGFKVSAVNSATAKVMLQLSYISRAGTSESKVVLRFVGASAVEERALWRGVLSELQLAKLPEVQVKPEPGTEAAANAAAAQANAAAAAPAPAPAAVAPRPVVPAAPAAQRAAPPKATAPAARPVAAAGAKRPHSQLNNAAAAAASPPAPAPAPAAPTISDLQSLIQSRAALLARDPTLKDLHSDLVPHSVTEDEFWSSPGRIALLREEQARQNLPLVGPGGPAQRVGISSSMGGVIKPESGCNVVRYTLDAAQINSIFLHNPTVHELYQSMVPAQISEKEFWTQYFKSQYIHAQATGKVQAELSKNVQVDDIFSRARAMQEARDNAALGLAHSQLHSSDPVAAAAQRAQEEEAKDVATKATLLSRAVDPSVDLAAADASDAVFGVDAAARSAGGAAGAAPAARSRREREHQALLQKYNRHGMLVLDSNLHSNQRNAAALAAAPSAGGSPSAAAEQKLQSAYHAGLSSSLELHDLTREVAPVYNELPIAAGRGFFANAGRKGGAESSTDTSEQTAAAASFRQELSSWDCVATPAAPHHIQHLPASSASLQLVTQLTATARGMNKAAVAAKQLREEGAGQQMVVFSTDGVTEDVLIPSQFSDELKKRYHTCTELFRHFWSSLTPRTAAKLRRVHRALDEQYQLLLLIRRSLHERHFSALVPVLNPLIASIDKCQATFTAWEEKEKKRMQQAPAAKKSAAAAAAAAKATPMVKNDTTAAMPVADEPEAKRAKA